MKFLVAGTNSLTLDIVEVILHRGHQVSLIGLDEKLLPNNSINLIKFAAEKEIEVFVTTDINNKRTANIIKNCHPDFLIISWPKIVSREVYSLPKFGTISSHPSKLPFGKGRHPLHWGIVNGNETTEICFFKIDDGIDTGNILDKEVFHIGAEHIVQVIENMNKAGKVCFERLLITLEKNPNYDGLAQNPNAGSISRKRTKHDIILDPRMNASVIERIVKSFSSPYPGAILLSDGPTENIVIDTHLLDETERQPDWKNYDCGHIFNIKFNSIFLRVSDGVIRLDCKDLKNCTPGESLHPPSKYISSSF